MESYSLKNYFGGKNDAYAAYKQGQKSGKWSDLNDYIAKGGSNTGSSGGTSNLNPSFLTDKIREFSANQATTSDNFLTNIRKQYGIDSLEQASRGITNQMLNVEGQLEKLPTQVANETRGFDVNAAQLDAITQNKQKPLVEQYSQLGRAAERAGGVLSDARNAVRDEISIMSDRLAREATLFSQGMQSELNVLLEKYRTGIMLSEGEKDRLNKLAIAEQDFENQKELLDIQLRQNKDLSTYQTNEQIRQTNATKTPENPLVNQLLQLQIESILKGQGGDTGSSFIPD